MTANFPPTNAVDMHRVRTSLHHYRSCGYRGRVVCFRPDRTDHPKDELLLRSVPESVEVEEVDCLSSRWAKRVGIRAVAFRGWFAMRRKLIRMVRSDRPDLVFFSTTSFPLMAIGPQLRTMFGTPYILDFQDPWISPEGSTNQPTLKNRLVRRIHSLLEPCTVSKAAGIIAVSQEYLNVLTSRYEKIAELPQMVIPFGWSETDIRISRKEGEHLVHDERSVAASLREDLQDRIVGLYAGAYVKTMEPMVRRLFRSVSKMSTSQRSNLRLWFVGSNYHDGDGESPLMKVAEACGVSEVIRELPVRIPYFHAMALTQRSSFNLLFGSTSKGYNPSKLFSLLSSERPLLAFVHPKTIAADLLQKAGGCRIVQVESESEHDEFDISHFLQDVAEEKLPGLNRSFILSYNAESMTKRQVALFDQVLSLGEQEST